MQIVFLLRVETYYSIEFYLIQSSVLNTMFIDRIIKTLYSFILAIIEFRYALLLCLQFLFHNSSTKILSLKA